MKPKEITEVIEKEINGNWTITNAHNVDLKKCLVRPRRKIFAVGQGEVEPFWLVLEECPETLECFKIVFNDKTHQFGLAQFGEPYDLVLGWHNNFLNALRAM